MLTRIGTGGNQRLEGILGEALVAVGDWDAAMDAFERVRRVAAHGGLAPEIAWRYGALLYLRGDSDTALEVLSAAERIIGRPVPHELVARRPGDPVALFADNQRAKDLLGWIPELELDDVLRSAWSWHSNHLHGYGD